MFTLYLLQKNKRTPDIFSPRINSQIVWLLGTPEYGRYNRSLIDVANYTWKYEKED